MSTAITGSCLCKSITYQLNANFQNAVNCHCNICKKITGGAFEAIALIEDNALQFTTGEDLLTSYQISELADKHFCKICGTPIFNLHNGVPGKAITHIGSLDDPTCVTPTVNIHSENMLPWIKTIGELHTFEQGFQTE